MPATTVSSYLGVWRTGSGEQRWFTGSPHDFASADAEHFSKGLRLVAIDRHSGSYWDANGLNLSPEDRMIGVWHPGSGAQYWKTGLNAVAFKTADAEYFAKGLRLVAIDTDGGKFTAVWREGSGAQHWHSGLSGKEFAAKDAAYFAQNLRLVAVDIDDGKLCGVWRAGTGPQRWFSASLDEVVQKNLELMKEGLRLVAIDHNDGQFIGVWHAGSGAEYWHTGLTVDEFKQKDAGFFKQGLRLVAVDIGSTTVDVPDKPTPSQPATGQQVHLVQEGKWSGAGGGSDWMNYSTTVQDLFPSKKQVITKVKNLSDVQISLTHGLATANLTKGAETDAFKDGDLAGYWSAVLIDVMGKDAPPTVTVDVRLA
jgi:hypothetical protein